MRAWFADADGRLHSVTACSSVGRAVGQFVAWRHGYEVFSAPRLLRATAVEGCTVAVRVREDRLPAVRDRYDGRPGIQIADQRLTVDDVSAVEVVHDTYPPAFERLFDASDCDLCLRVRGGAALLLDAELVSITATGPP